MSTRGVDAPYSNEIWSVIPRLSAMRSNCSMVGLSFPQLILFRYCLVQPNLLASSASLMHFSTNAFFKSIFVSFFIFLAFGRGTPKSKARKKRILPQSLGVSSQISFNKTLSCLSHEVAIALRDFVLYSIRKSFLHSTPLYPLLGSNPPLFRLISNLV